LFLGLTVGLGFAFVPQGCGGVTPAAEMPESVAWQFRACAVEHENHLGALDPSVSFDVNLDTDGQVDSISLRHSSLGDEELEKCLVAAIRSLSEDDLPLRYSQNRDRDPITPESRMLMGHPEALAACLVSPPCLLTLTLVVGAAVITVQLYVNASSKPRPPKATPHVNESHNEDPKPAGDPSTTGPTGPTPPPSPPPPPDCPRNESFSPIRTDDATGCIDKNGKVRCYSSKHYPCAGPHTHGKLSYQEIRNGICKAVERRAVRCEGPFKVSGSCGSAPTVECKSGGPETSGILGE
jgi:hypothetical protein